MDRRTRKVETGIVAAVAAAVAEFATLPCEAHLTGP